MIYPNSEGKKILFEYYKILWMVSIKEIWYMECKCVLNLMRQNNQLTDRLTGWAAGQPASQAAKPNQTKPNQNKPNPTQPNQTTNQPTKECTIHSNILKLAAMSGG